ncbi:TlpA family protein disulfide reductase [Mucilaginibacter sp. Bleaf8]|uniref:TlpA family protein disulfide reductase n=1 Tax=Mucilaginibacter sp. Bleaf8 TaxID=2834430 RepID=UPI001BCD6D8E|nr:TlpA disulfide reductase family protein [Mucilaginibacter sp. Bleaf8]MBS7565539.1 TlpA family protein disulfide reductase [Mucilaginibacter sp. Bleaf8]
MKLKICLLGLLCLFLRAHAQKTIEDRGLPIGATVPDLTITDITGYDSPSLPLHTLSDKLIILDFWATWCSACISHFPDLYALQRRHPKDLQIILVNSKKVRDRPENAIAFLEKRRKYYQFPCVLNDTVLNNLFPHKEIPHLVWIKDNKVQAITTAESVTEANIRKMLNGDSLRLAKKGEIAYDFQKPLFVAGNGGNAPGFIYHSFLTPYVEGLSGGFFFHQDDNGLISRITLPNCMKITAYRVANPAFAGFPDTRTLYRVKNPAEYSPDSTSSKNWRARNEFCYEASFAPRSKAAALQLMRNDLDHYFSLRFDTSRIDTLCFVLRRSPDGHLPVSSAGTKHETNMNDGTRVPVYFHHYSLGSILQELEVRYKMPFIDETGFEPNVDLTLPYLISNKEALARSFAKQGFSLTLEKRPVTFLVLSERTD